LYGQMVDMKKLKDIAGKHNLKVIEDSAHVVE
jgi:dTDP-4-amino-4,6-dideoxygalactose transaminase